MKVMKITLFSFILMGLVSCSGSKVAQTEGEDAGIEVAEMEEFGEEDIAIDEIGNEAMPMEETADAGEPVMADPAAGVMPAQVAGTPGEYTVEKNETLMLIAFKLFGDYKRWKDLLAWNSEALSGSTNLAAGMVLKYEAPAETFTWNPAGNPYLIQSGDTLGTISNTTYGNKKYWKDIWKNNEPLIIDPNKIYAGFTIYTPELQLEGEQLAFNDKQP